MDQGGERGYFGKEGTRQGMVWRVEGREAWEGELTGGGGRGLGGRRCEEAVLHRMKRHLLSRLKNVRKYVLHLYIFGLFEW